MAAVSTLILRSLRLIGEKPRGGTLSSAEQTECLASLNQMMESWSLDRLMCYATVQDSFALTASQGSYTIGSGGDFNTTRPLKIVDPCFIRDASGYDSYVRVIDSQAYGEIVDKSGSNSYPIYLYYTPDYVTARGTIQLYPYPSAGLTLYINSWRQLGQFSTISHSVSLPPGYERAIVYNYAIEEAGGYTEVSPDVVRIARESKAAIKSVNLPDVHMQVDAGISQHTQHNILTG